MTRVNKKIARRNRLTSIYEETSQTITAAVDGAIIPLGSDYVNGVGTDGETGFYVVLADEPIGKEVMIKNVSGYAFNIVTSAPATIGINTGVGASVVLALATAKTAICTRITATEWNIVIFASATAA